MLKKLLMSALFLLPVASFAAECGDIIVGTWKTKIKVKESGMPNQSGLYQPGYSIKADLTVTPTASPQPL